MLSRGFWSWRVEGLVVSEILLVVVEGMIVMGWEARRGGPGRLAGFGDDMCRGGGRRKDIAKWEGCYARC